LKLHCNNNQHKIYILKLKSWKDDVFRRGKTYKHRHGTTGSNKVKSQLNSYYCLAYILNHEWADRKSATFQDIKGAIKINFENETSSD
jgi:putative NADPH-quinone reductase